MTQKKKNIIFLLAIFIILYIIYIFLLFPNIEKGMTKAHVSTNIEAWEETPFDSLTYYYIERGNIPSIEQLLNKTKDSIFVVNYLKSHPYSVTLKNPNKYLVHFTNNQALLTMKCYSWYLKTKNEDYLKFFWKNTDWILKNNKIIRDTIALITNDNMVYGKYNLRFGWPSAFAQGYCLSVLCRAYQDSKKEEYLDLAEKFLNSFNLHYKKGGIVDIDNNGLYWYLEYPANPPAYVLNGMIFGLFGIYDYYRITNSKKAFRYFLRGVKTIEENIQKYDKGYWSAYDLEYNRCAGFNYHKHVHIPQLKILYTITNIKKFSDYYTRFQNYLDEPWLTIFKTKFTFEAILRRLTYKNPLKKFTKKRFK